MRHRHRSPKTWANPPRSRRAREAASPSYTTTTDVIRELWGDTRERPAWAKLALKCGWITSGQFYAIPQEITGRRPFSDLVYSNGPFFRMLPKTDWRK